MAIHCRFAVSPGHDRIPNDGAVWDRILEMKEVLIRYMATASYLKTACWIR